MIDLEIIHIKNLVEKDGRIPVLIVIVMTCLRDCVVTQQGRNQILITQKNVTLKSLWGSTAAGERLLRAILNNMTPFTWSPDLLNVRKWFRCFATSFALTICCMPWPPVYKGIYQSGTQITRSAANTWLFVYFTFTRSNLCVLPAEVPCSRTARPSSDTSG